MLNSCTGRGQTIPPMSPTGKWLDLTPERLLQILLASLGADAKWEARPGLTAEDVWQFSLFRAWAVPTTWITARGKNATFVPKPRMKWRRPLLLTLGEFENVWNLFILAFVAAIELRRRYRYTGTLSLIWGLCRRPLTEACRVPLYSAVGCSEIPIFVRFVTKATCLIRREWLSIPSHGFDPSILVAGRSPLILLFFPSRRVLNCR